MRVTNGKDWEGNRFIRGLGAALDRRRRLILSRLDGLPALFSYQRPRGAYYVFPRIVPTSIRSMDLALRLLYEAKTVTVPGNGFGPTGEGHLRLSFGGTEEEIGKAFDRLEEWARAAGFSG